MVSILRAFDRLGTNGRNQPNGYLSVDWTHSLAQGLVGYFPFGHRNMGNIVNGFSWTNGTTIPSPTTNAWGPAHDFTAASASMNACASGKILGGSPAFSIAFAAGDFNNAGLHIAYGEQGGSGNDLVYIGNNGGSTLFWYRDDAGTLVQQSGGSIGAGEYHMISCSMTIGATNGMRQFFDGIFTAQNTYSGTTNFTDTLTACLGNTLLNTTNGGIGTLNWIALWKRALRDDEHLQLYIDPFGFLIPAERELPVAKVGVAPSTANFRRTLSSLGTRTGTRQLQGWS